MAVSYGLASCEDLAVIQALVLDPFHLDLVAIVAYLEL